MGLAKKGAQTVESTCNRTGDYIIAGVNSVTELSKLAVSVSAFVVVMTCSDSQSFFVS